MIGIYVNGVAEETDHPIIVEALQKNIDFVLFINELSRVRNPNIVIMHAADMWKFRGPIISTCEITSLFLEKCPTPTKKYTTVKDREFNEIKKINGLNEVIDE